MSSIQKTTLIAAIIDRLREELRVLEDARAMANEEAMPSDDVAESQRENRSLEYQFLVDGQGRVAREHKEAIHAFETLEPRTLPPDSAAELGALVEVETGGERTLYFLGPKAGGLEVSVDGEPVYVLTLQSPLGRRLFGRKAGDAFPLENTGGDRSARILAVS